MRAAAVLRWLGWCFGVAALAWLETWRFRALLVLVAVGLGWRWWRRRRRTAVVALLAAGVVVADFPRRTSDAEATTQSLVLDARGAEVPMPLLAWLASAVPETELVRLSTAAAPVFPWPVRGRLLGELQRLSAADNPFVAEHRRLVRSGQERALPSALPLQLGQDLGWWAGLSHVVVLRPARVTRPLPVVVFLHGFLGNLQAYASVLGGLEDVVVLIPSAPGLAGRWTEEDVARVLGPQLDAVAARVPIDLGAVHLVGLSNGGLGLAAAAQRWPGRFASVTAVSTWAEGAERFSRTTPRLFVCGAQDLACADNAEAVRALVRAGLPARLAQYAGEGHFVLLTQRAAVLAALQRQVTPGTSSGRAAGRGAR